MTVATVQRVDVLDLVAALRLNEAVVALRSSWPGLAVEPGDLPADILFAIGILNSNLGLSEQNHQAHEIAKNCLSRASRLLKSGDKDLCEIQLCLAYWRAGDDEESLIQFVSILERPLSDFNRFRALLGYGSVLGSQERHKEEADALAKARPLLDSASTPFKGRFHMEAAYNRRRLGGDYADKCLEEYTAALVCFEQCKAEILEASTRNNIAGIYADLRDFRQAHKHVDRAIEINLRLGDQGRLAQCYDQQAQIFLAQAQPTRAAQCASDAIRLSAGGTAGWAIDCRITFAKTLARMKDARALDEFSTAIQTARRQTNRPKETEAALTALEELQLESALMLEWFLLADRSDDRKRVTAVLRKVAGKLTEIADYEDVKLAMIEHKGNIKHAALALGYNSHTGLLPFLNKHPELRLKQKYKRSRR